MILVEKKNKFCKTGFPEISEKMKSLTDFMQTFSN